MSQKIKMRASELADLIVKDVRRHRHCEEFSSISVYRLEDGQIPDVNWSASSANYGRSGQKACDDALREIIPRMQKQYQLKDE